MDDTPNAPDLGDALGERAVDTGRPTPPQPGAGAGRAINAAFTRNRATPPGSGGVAGSAGDRDKRGEGGPAGGQQEGFQGAGYPIADRDGPEDPEEEEDDLGDEGEDDLDDDDLGEEEEETEDDDGYRVHEEAEGLETGDGMLEELMTPPGGEDLGGDRDTDPNLNGGHGIRMQAPEEGPVAIEDEPTDLSILGHGHEGKAAWNRERTARLQEMEGDEPGLRPATSEAAGLGGAALGGALQGWEGGGASPTIEQGDDAFDAELSEEEEVLGDMRLKDAEDVLRDDSIADPDRRPFLPEHRELPDEDLALEELLLATPGEDVLSSGAEIGVAEELEAEDLNLTDTITRRFEDQRDALDSAMDGNERRGGVGGD